MEASKRQDLPLLQVGVAAGLASIPQLSGGVPKGYLRVLVFDKDSALVSQQTQQLSQAAKGGYEPLRLQVRLPQDGYVSAYVGNESDVDVLFDDVQLEHRPGLQVQETQYDPAGLKLAWLAPPSPGIRGLNNYRFNGKEFQADLGLNWTQLDWRMVDQQLLHLHSVDPEIENGQESMSPYAFGFDNAVRYNDPNGRAPGDPWYRQVADWATNTLKGLDAGLQQRFQVEPARGATRTGLRDMQAGRMKAGKPVGDWAVRADQAHPGAPYPHFNVNTNPKVTGIKDPHVAIPGGVKTLESLEMAGKTLEVLGKFAKPIAIATDAIRIGEAVHADGGRIGLNTARTSVSVVGGWAGAYLGAAAGSQGGAWAGGAIGVWFGGAGAVPGAAIGGFIGGLGGGVLGAFGVSSAGEAVVDAVTVKK